MLFAAIQRFSGSAGGGPGKLMPRPQTKRMSFGMQYAKASM